MTIALLCRITRRWTMSNGILIGIVIGGWILNAAIFRALFCGKAKPNLHATDEVGEAWWKDPNSV